MDVDKKIMAGAAAAVAAGVAGAVAYTALKGTGGGDKAVRPPKGPGKRRGSEPAASPEGAIDLNKAGYRDLMALKHIGKARAKRILHARPIRSVEDLVSRGLVPAEVLDAVRDRLTV